MAIYRPKMAPPIIENILRSDTREKVVADSIVAGRSLEPAAKRQIAKALKERIKREDATPGHADFAAHLRARAKLAECNGYLRALK